MGKAFVISVLCVALCACSGIKSGIRPVDIAGEPEVYCNVIMEPNPLLVGSWKANFIRPHEDEPGANDANYVQYWLGKRDGKYALYFYRTSRSGKKRYVGWRDWNVGGNEISSPTGTRIFVQDGEVYFSLMGETPIRMRRAALNG